MITLEYMGLKPSIRSDGVFFQSSKEDKFIYIPYAFKLLETLENSSLWVGKHVEVSFLECNVSPQNVITTLATRYKDFEKYVDNKTQHYKNARENEITLIKEFNESALVPVSRNALANNLDHFKTYRTKRFVNKLVYHYLINLIVDIFYKRSINSVKIPPSKNFLHVLESIKNGVIGKKVYPYVDIVYETINERPTLILRCK